MVKPAWSFLSTHGLVLLAIARDPDATQRQIGDAVGVTERTAQKAIHDLEAAGFLVRVRQGRRTRYVLQVDEPLRHDMLSPTFYLRDLVQLLSDT